MPSLGAVARGLKPGRAGQRGVLPRLWLFSDPIRLPDPRAALAALPRGAGLVARGVAPALLPELARLARGQGARMLLGAAPRAALRLRCGLHWPDRAAGSAILPYLMARRAGLPWAMLSVAAHGPAGLLRAARLKADLVFLSPAFPTRSHPGAPALGPLRWAALARRAGRPVVALGGIAPATAGRLPRKGCGASAGLAAIGGLLPLCHSVSTKSLQSVAKDCPAEAR